MITTVQVFWQTAQASKLSEVFYSMNPNSKTSPKLGPVFLTLYNDIMPFNDDDT